MGELMDINTMKKRFLNSLFGKNAYSKLEKQVKDNPHICCICGAVETMDNLILRYDKGYICDNCLSTAYPDEVL